MQGDFSSLRNDSLGCQSITSIPAAGFDSVDRRVPSMLACTPAAPPRASFQEISIVEAVVGGKIRDELTNDTTVYLCHVCMYPSVQVCISLHLRTSVR